MCRKNHAETHRRNRSPSGGARCRLLFLSAFLLLLLCSGCGKEEVPPLPEESTWREWRIGTPLAWSPDYYLTVYEEVPNLYRYDTAGDCILGLQFDYVDALALDSLYAYEVLRQYPEFEMLDTVIGTDSLLAYITHGREDLQAQMNEYIPRFRESEIYADLLERANAEEFIPNADIPEHTDGEVIRVAVAADSGNYPYTYYDFNTKGPQGVDVEFVKNFAYEYGYTIEWFDSSWGACSIAVTNGEVDVFVCAISDYYRTETIAMDLCLCSDTYFDLDLVLVAKKERGDTNGTD